MNARISIDFDRAEGAVLRLIGLVERRGFEVRGIAMGEHASDGTASMTLDVSPRDAGRRLEVLDLQLRRLHGVRSIATFAPPAGSVS